MAGEHPDGFHLFVLEQVALVDDQDGCSSSLCLFPGEGVGGLGDEGGGVEAGHSAEGGDDVVQDSADPDDGVGEVDGDVPGGVQRGGSGADPDGCPGADITGDDPDVVLFDAPGDSGDGYGVGAVAAQNP